MKEYKSNESVNTAFCSYFKTLNNLRREFQKILGIESCHEYHHILKCGI